MDCRIVVGAYARYTMIPTHVLIEELYWAQVESVYDKVLSASRDALVTLNFNYSNTDNHTAIVPQV
jgi:hypothetical protein